MRNSKSKMMVAMLKAGLQNQKALAAKAGLSENTISTIARGGTVKLETLRKVAAALECDPLDLLEED